MNIPAGMVLAKYGVVVAFSIGAVFAVKSYNKMIFNNGVQHQIEVQEALDAQADPIVDDLGQEQEEAKEKRDEKLNTIRTEVHTGITEAFLEKSTANAEQTGKELGRAEAYAEYTANGGCLTVPYDPSSKLLNNWKDQQRDIFGDVVGDGGADKTE